MCHCDTDAPAHCIREKDSAQKPFYVLDRMMYVWDRMGRMDKGDAICGGIEKLKKKNSFATTLNIFHDSV